MLRIKRARIELRIALDVRIFLAEDFFVVCVHFYPRCHPAARHLAVCLLYTSEQEQVRLVMVPVGESRLELLEATSETSAIAKFIAKRGEGLHHVCLKVSDLPASVARLKKDGVRLVSDEIKTGAGGHQYVFVHPASTGGVLLELVQE